MNKAAPKIVHESETQRQFIRLQLPASIQLDGTSHTVKDLSSGGFSVRNPGHDFKKNQDSTIVLVLPFADFALDIDLKAEMVHHDKKANVIGWRFVDLNANQISILNHVIKAFMSGDLIGANDIINVVSRDNFVNVRKHNNDNPQTATDNIKRYGLYALAAAAILLLGGFIVNNILQQVLIVKSPYGQVHASRVEMISPSSGTFQSALTEGSQAVKKGQDIGYVITGRATAGAAPTRVSIKSPCDCFVEEFHANNGTYILADSKITTLLPRNSKITIKSFIPYEDIHKLNIGMPAVAMVTGVKEPVKGIITDVNSMGDVPAAGLAPMAEVIVTPDNALSNDYLDRPAFVEFHL